MPYNLPGTEMFNCRYTVQLPVRLQWYGVLQPFQRVLNPASSRSCLVSTEHQLHIWEQRKPNPPLQYRCSNRDGTRSDTGVYSGTTAGLFPLSSPAQPRFPVLSSAHDPGLGLNSKQSSQPGPNGSAVKLKAQQCHLLFKGHKCLELRQEDSDTWWNQDVTLRIRMIGIDQLAYKSR